MFLGFTPSFWLTFRIIRTSNLVGLFSRPQFDLTPGIHVPTGPPSFRKAREIIDERLHVFASMLVMASEHLDPACLVVGDGERFAGPVVLGYLRDCLELAPGPVADRLYREFRDWLRSLGGTFRSPSRRRYLEITVDAAGVVRIIPDEPLREDLFG